MNAVERITYPGGNGILDEIVLTNCTVHLEQMNKRDWCLIIDRDEDDIHLMLNVRKVLPQEMIVNGMLLPDGMEWRRKASTDNQGEL